MCGRVFWCCRVLVSLACCIVVASQSFAALATDYDTRNCQSPLGMHEGRIPDESLTASSSFDEKSTGPQNARLHKDDNGGAWCPKNTIKHNVTEYLEVSLAENHLITMTETQGRFGNGVGMEYAETFMVEYWRDSLQEWVVYKDAKGETVLTANSNTYTSVRQELELPFVASKVRFIPYSYHPRTVCMRVELYGCYWEQGIVSYKAPKGVTRNRDGDLEDVSYDGILDDGTMRDGLGQLTDGLFGDDDFTPDPKGQGAGNRWVGWTNDSTAGDDLELMFVFDELRLFSAVHLHTNNMISKGVKVFSQVLLYFSIDGEKYHPQVERLMPPPDKKETARNVTVITLPERLGRFLKVQLKFASRLILLSEVTFDSALVPSNLTDALVSMFYSSQGNPDLRARKEITPAAPTNNQTYIGLITGVLAMVILLLVTTTIIMIRRNRKKDLLHKHTALKGPLAEKKVTINMKDLKMNMNLTPMNNGISRAKGNIYGHVAVEESDSENSSIYHEPYKLPSSKQEYGCLLKKDALSSSKSGEYTDFTSVNSFQDDVKFTSPSYYNLTPPPPPTSRPPPYDVQNFTTPTKTPTTPIENYYAATDIVKTERREQHFTPGKFTPIKIPEGDPVDGEPTLVEFPRHRIRLVEKLGEGCFGMVHLCEAEGIPDYGGVTSFHKKLVVVKSLWRGCSESTRQEFIRETSWLASLSDLNLARVIAVCSQDDPLCAIIEYLDQKDLPQFLQQSRQSGSNGYTSSLSYGCLIYLATQVASGMKYMESLDLAHRDLAARNCVVGKNFVVKITDYAMYCSRFDGDYYISDTKARLPIRWMAWESLLLGKHSPKSDVWSFAVTLWEVLMLAGHQPFAELTNEQVVENSNHWYQNDGLQRYLGRPPSCPREIYDLMCECWKRQETERPRFSEIHLFLQRKNLGYVPGTM